MKASPAQDCNVSHTNLRVTRWVERADVLEENNHQLPDSPDDTEACRSPKEKSPTTEDPQGEKKKPVPEINFGDRYCTSARTRINYA